MEIRWTSKTLSDLARLYEFLEPVDTTAAARTVQMLTAAPVTLQANPALDAEWRPPSLMRFGDFSWVPTNCAARSTAARSSSCACFTLARIADHGAYKHNARLAPAPVERKGRCRLVGPGRRGLPDLLADPPST